MTIRKLKLAWLFLIGLYTISYSQTPSNSIIKHSPLEMDSVLKQGSEYDLIKPLIGNSKVVQTIIQKMKGK